MKFYKNGALFTPSSISDVKIYDAETAGTLIATITPVLVSTGIYSFTWTPTVAGGYYYDEWTWVAVSGMVSKTQRYKLLVRAGPTATGVARSGPLFVGPREVSFFNGINKELMQDIVCQKIIYYSVAIQHTNAHRLYDEAVRKTVYTPVEVNALVLYQEPEQKVDQFTVDTIYKIEVYFYQEELRERELIPRVGDFVKFGNVVYEMEKLNRPQITYGQIDKEVMIKAICRVARESQFKVLDDIPGVSQ